MFNQVFIPPFPIFLHKLQITLIRAIEERSIDFGFNNFQESFSAFRCLAPLVGKVGAPKYVGRGTESFTILEISYNSGR
jgi:hypothetical protein